MKITDVKRVVILVSLFVFFIVFPVQTKIINRLIDNYLYDNKLNYIDCDKLPELAKAEKALVEHNDLIRELEDVKPGVVSVSVNSSKCPGKGDVDIYYGSHEERSRIEDIINDSTFFGIPYNLKNI